MADKYPELRDLFGRLTQEKEALRERTADLWEEYTQLREDLGALQVKARTVAEQIKAIERPRLSEIDNELSAIARAMGGYRLSDEGPLVQEGA